MRLLGLFVACFCLIIGTGLGIIFSFWPVVAGGAVSFMLFVIGTRFGLFR